MNEQDKKAFENLSEAVSLESHAYFVALLAWKAACEYKDAQLAAKDSEIALLKGLLARYRDETPIGHQPHMIAKQVDDALGR